MRRLVEQTALGAITLLCLTAGPVWAGEIFADDFSYVGTPDPNKWEIQNPAMVHGLSRMGLPPVADGDSLVFEHHAYDEENPGTYCLGGEIYSKENLADRTGFEELLVRWRVRFETNDVGGVVAACFLYMDQPQSEYPSLRMSDEIDIELLSNLVEVFPDLEGHHPWLASYDGFCSDLDRWYDGVKHWASYPLCRGLDLTEWNTLTISWRAGSVTWCWERPGIPAEPVGWSTAVVPDDPMSLYVNIWASDEYWPIAWHSEMVPAGTTTGDKISRFLLDSVSVRLSAQGDASRDDLVDDNDLSLLLANWACPEFALWEQGDFTGEGTVDDNDLSLLLAGWQGEGGGNQIAEVPEPASVCLVASCALVLAIRRRRFPW